MRLLASKLYNSLFFLIHSAFPAIQRKAENGQFLKKIKNFLIKFMLKEKRKKFDNFFSSKDSLMIALQDPRTTTRYMHSFKSFLSFLVFDNLKKKFSEKNSKISIFVPLGAHTGVVGAGSTTAICGLQHILISSKSLQ